VQPASSTNIGAIPIIPRLKNRIAIPLSAIRVDQTISLFGE
jgi:hypothetical protein